MREVFKVIFAILFGGGFLLLIFHCVRELVKIIMEKTKHPKDKTAFAGEVKNEIAADKIDA